MSKNYGKNVNDLVFTITYQPRTQATYEVLTKILAGQEQEQVEQQDEGDEGHAGSHCAFPS